MKLGHLLRHGWIQRLIQSEVSQKEKNKYRILTHICGTQKNGTDEPVFRSEIETQMQRTKLWTPRGESSGGVGGGGVMNWAIGIDMYTLMCIKLMTNKNLLYKEKLKYIYIYDRHMIFIIFLITNLCYITYIYYIYIIFYLFMNYFLFCSTFLY